MTEDLKTHLGMKEDSRNSHSFAKSVLTALIVLISLCQSDKL